MTGANENQNLVKGLPLGTNSFPALREFNQIYVDKTAMIGRLAGQPVNLFFARPRRFGKSLLLSTFESLFRDGLRYFEGLAIEKSWKDKTYDVLHLDFSRAMSFASAEEFLLQFGTMLDEACEDGAISLPKDEPDPLKRLSAVLRRRKPGSLVLLVDEYDAPLTNCMDNEPLFATVRESLSKIYSLVKSQDGALRFLFITGITKFSKTSIFSAFNNLMDISLDPDYGSLLGYTGDELRRDFAPYLSNAAQRLSMTQDELLEALRVNYDGFCFDLEASRHVYCPWSVLCFLTSPMMRFKNYWYTSGGRPSVLMKYLTKQSLQKPALFAQLEEIRVQDLDAANDYATVSPVLMLYQAGYLTVKRAVNAKSLLIGYPNQEVADSVAMLYADEIVCKEKRSWEGFGRVQSILSCGKVGEVVALFNQAVNTLDYQRFPIRDEASCRSHMQVLLIGASLLPNSEVYSALGRSDLEVRTGDRYGVFEFKYAKTGAEAEKLLAEGVAQARALGAENSFAWRWFSARRPTRLRHGAMWMRSLSSRSVPSMALNDWAPNSPATKIPERGGARRAAASLKVVQNEFYPETADYRISAARKRRKISLALLFERLSKQNAPDRSFQRSDRSSAPVNTGIGPCTTFKLQSVDPALASRSDFIFS